MRDAAYDFTIRELTEREKNAMEMLSRLCAHSECPEKPTHIARYQVLFTFGMARTVRNMLCDKHAKAFSEINRISTTQDASEKETA